MKRLKQLMIIIVMFSQSLDAFSQDGEYITVRDFETWSSVSLKYKLNKKLKFGLEEQIRFRDNSSLVDAYFTEGNIKYDFNKHFFGGFGFRYIRQNDTEGKIQGYESHTRFDFDLGYQHKIKRLSLEYRLRFQTKDEVGSTADEDDHANNHWRLKTEVGYDIKKWKFDPEFSAEIFRHYEVGEENGFDKFRMSVGSKYETKSFGDFGLFYRMEIEMNVTYPKTTNIVGLKYSYTLKNKKK